MRPASVAACAISAKSCASAANWRRAWRNCGAAGHDVGLVTEDRQRVRRQRPRRDVQHKRRQLAGNLVKVGIISSRPWLAVKLVARAPEVSAPCNAPAAHLPTAFR